MIRKERMPSEIHSILQDPSQRLAPSWSHGVMSSGFTLVPTQLYNPVLPSPTKPLLQEGRDFHHFCLCFILRAHTSLDRMHCGYWINICWWPNDIPMADLSGVLDALSCHRLNYTLLDGRDPVIGIHWYSIYLRISSLGFLKLNF